MRGKFKHQTALQLHLCATCDPLQHGSTSYSLQTTGPCSWFRVIPKKYSNIEHNGILPKPIQFAVYYDTIMRHIITKRYDDVKQNDEAVRRGTNSYATSCSSITANCRILPMTVRIHHFVLGSWYSTACRQIQGRTASSEDRLSAEKMVISIHR